MPLYMDIHELGEVTAEDVAKAHVADLEAQEKYGVNYLKYWVNENRGKVFCLVEAPNAEAAHSCHREAHGLVARKIIEIQPELADGFLGDVQTNPAGAALLPGGGADARDPGIRTVLFTDMVESTTFTQSLDSTVRIPGSRASAPPHAIRESGRCCSPIWWSQRRSLHHIGEQH